MCGSVEGDSYEEYRVLLAGRKENVEALLKAIEVLTGNAKHLTHTHEYGMYTCAIYHKRLIVEYYNVYKEKAFVCQYLCHYHRQRRRHHHHHHHHHYHQHTVLTIDKL